MLGEEDQLAECKDCLRLCTAKEHAHTANQPSLCHMYPQQALREHPMRNFLKRLDGANWTDMDVSPQFQTFLGMKRKRVEKVSKGLDSDP